MSEPTNRNESGEIESPFMTGEVFAAEESVKASASYFGAFSESPFLRAFESATSFEEAEEASFGWERESAEGLRKRLKHMALLPHSMEWALSDVRLSPRDPGIYEGPNNYKLAPKLQDCLKAVMKKKQFSHIKVALVDLTKSASQPEFAGVNHTDQVSSMSIPKLAAMLAAFQLRHDLRVALKTKSVDNLKTLYELTRDDWAASQIDPKKLVLVRGKKVAFAKAPNAPEVERIFKDVPEGNPVVIEFSSTGEDAKRLEELAGSFLERKSNSRENLEALGFAERLRLMMSDKKTASDFVTFTIIRDLGYAYIASTLLQTGLYDSKRGGGLWLGADYAGGKWSKPLSGGDPRSANAGSLAAFLTLLAQGNLADRQSSTEMLELMKNEFTVTPGRVGFMQGLEQLEDEGSIVSVHSRGGVDKEGMDECALIERRVEKGNEVVRYIAVALRAKRTAEMKALILELDKCILDNNEFSTVKGGHASEHELDRRSAEGPSYESAEWGEASFETETEPLFSSEAPFLSEEELGIIGEHDDRTPVKDTQAVPFRWICSIAVQRRIKTAATERKTGLAPAGTGVLISPRHVLTAAHLLRSVTTDGQGSITERHEAQLVSVKPGRDEDADPFGEIEAESWSLHPKWNPEKKVAEFDYAVITLKEAVGDRTFKSLSDEPLCYWGSLKCGAGTSVDNLPSSVAGKLVGARVLTAGYPTEAKGQMWCAAGTLSAGSSQLDSVLTRNSRAEDWARRARTVSLTADASEGQSGSPVWVVENGKRYLVGILVSISKDYNQAVNINSDVVRQIQGWIGKGKTGGQSQKLIEEPGIHDEEFEEAEAWESLEQEAFTSQRENEEIESADDETEVDSSKEFEELYGLVYEHEPDLL